jgi:hypothetical protein
MALNEAIVLNNRVGEGGPLEGANDLQNRWLHDQK